MDACQRYQFETAGFIVLEECLGSALVAELLAAAQSNGPQLFGNHKKGGILHWSKGFRDLLDVPRVSAVLEEIYAGDRERCPGLPVGSPVFRIDHINCHTHGAFNPNLAGTSLHGGNQLLSLRSQGDNGEDQSALLSTYYDKDAFGRLHNGLVSVTFELEDTTVNGGGFCCLPGSHKTPSEMLPNEWRDLSKPLHPLIQAVPAKAGDCIIFTEALVHGTLPWRASTTRTTLFYKTTPRHTAWTADEDFFNPEDT